MQLRYKYDCEELFGRILDNSAVVSTIVQGICTRQTEELWKEMDRNEPYNVDLLNASSENVSERIARLGKYTKYDLVSAVNRQSSFFYQVREGIHHISHRTANKDNATCSTLEIFNQNHFLIHVK